MAWDKVAWGGRCITVKGKGSLYVAKLFEITEGCAVFTEEDGSMPDLEDHRELIPGSAAIVMRWNSDETAVEASRLYLACDPTQEAIWKRLFISMAAHEESPEYGGMVSISTIDTVDGNTIIDVGNVGTLILRASGSGSEAPQEILHVGPGYREVATIQDGSDSVWIDGDWKFTGDGFASLGTFAWDAPAMRPEPEDEPCGPDPA